MPSDYLMSINQAINYIYQNLDKSLTVEEIAEQCCFSKYYFNRVFKLTVGQNIYSFIKKIKLESAAFKLRAAKNRPITTIAIESGYSPSNFASAFKQYFDVSASDYRKMNDVPFKDSFAAVAEHIRNMKKDKHAFEAISAKMRIRRIEGMNLMYKRVICNYTKDLKEAWDLFCKEMGKQCLLDKDYLFVGISYDDPLIANEDRCMYDMCIAVDKPTSVNVHRIPSGLYACYNFYDKLNKFMLAFNEIVSLWLPYCQYKLDNRPMLEIYHSEIDEKGNIRAEICIPIQDS